MQIEALIQQGISGNEIAIIYRNHAQVATITTMLEGKKIPINTKRKVDILQLPFIQNILLILNWINKESQKPYSSSADDILFLFLHSDFFKISPLEIATLTMKASSRNRGSSEDKYTLRRLIAESPAPKTDLFTQPDGHSIKEVSNALEELIKASVNNTLQQLIELVIQKAGVLSYVMQSPEKPWLMQVLNAFFNQVKEENKKNPELTLADWLTDIETMKKNRISIPLYKITASDEGVNMVTAHGAKGSEFAHVFVIGCTQKIWDDSNKSGNRNYKLPDNLVNTNRNASDLEESRRLFYVAITRAKTHLHISYPAKDEKDKEQIKSNFITELLEESNLTTT